MSVDLGEQPAPAPDPDEALASAINELDAARECYLDASQKYYKFPTNGRSRELDATAEQTCLAMLNALKASCESNPDVSSDERCRILGTLIYSEDSTRTERLKETTGSMAFVPSRLNVDVAIDHVRQLCASDARADLVPILLRDYGDDLEKDTNHLRDLASGGRSMKVLELGSAMGKHSLDLVKITAGVFIGGWLLRKTDS